ncbi:MAG: sigma 54-interacting transcriptional regulator [Hespellia sp.]|jgi:transcriptional regulator with PAS, ATPase and Fis domain|nr:sigma 54-interacting transcriptional regulator [Hespellia sp.]
MQKYHTFPRSDTKQFQEHFQNNLWNYTYLDRNLKSIFVVEKIPPHVCLAYFDADGFLIELYGDTESVDTLSKLGISTGTIWTEEGIGYNAITAGLTRKQAVSSSGTEHDLPALKDLALYYCPISLRRLSVDYMRSKPPQDFGGVAVIVPLEYDQTHYSFLSAAIAHDTVMTLHFNQHAIRLYEQVGSGLLIIDSRMNREKVTITHANQTLFRALGIPPRDLFFSPLEDFLDPRTNSELWDLVKKQEDAKDVHITLTIEKKAIHCMITCLAFNQPFLNASGIICYITTPQMESRSVARKMGNSAILSFPNIIGESSSIRSAIHRATLIANTDSNVMILGESGVGKDVFAQAIHNASLRKNKPFIAVNCGALPRDLIASELFGYDSGAFTGAKRNGNIGKFELANGGTIFLDEIGDLPLDLQANLLRVVEQKQLMRLGSNRLIDIDVKIISATNTNMSHMIEQRLFRSDLFFRLSTLRLSLAPLRERENDVVLLANHFIETISQRIGRKDSMRLSTEAEELLTTLSWPGNVRELQNLMECIVQLYPDPIILPQHILENISLGSTDPNLSATSIVPGMTDLPFTRSMPRKRKVLSKEDIQNALDMCGGNRSQAAEYLGIARKTLYRKMEQFGIEGR